MFTLVIGGSGSGKSAYAEKLLDGFSGKKYYLATMQVYDDEGRKKVKKHEKNREGKGFQTIERPRNLGEVCFVFEDHTPTAVLLECMSNLVANEMFLGEEPVSAEAVVSKVISDVKCLYSKAKNLVVVTNNVFEDGMMYDESTEKYKEALGKVNQQLVELADSVVEVIVGIPIFWKGGVKV